MLDGYLYACLLGGDQDFRNGSEYVSDRNVCNPGLIGPLPSHIVCHPVINYKRQPVAGKGVTFCPGQSGFGSDPSFCPGPGGVSRFCNVSGPLALSVRLKFLFSFAVHGTRVTRVFPSVLFLVGSPFSPVSLSLTPRWSVF